MCSCARLCRWPVLVSSEMEYSQVALTLLLKKMSICENYTPQKASGQLTAFGMRADLTT